MSRRARRIIIPLIVSLAALGVLVVMFNPNKPARQQAQTATAPAATQPATTSSAAPATQADAAATTAPATQAWSTLRAVAPEAGDQPLQAAGSLDPRQSLMQVEFSRWGAGIKRIAFSDIWETAADKRKAAQYFQTLQQGDPFDPSKLDNVNRYVLVARDPRIQRQANGVDTLTQTPVLAAYEVSINGRAISLVPDSIWSETGPGSFMTQIVDEQDRPVARITRRYEIGPAYDINLEQCVENLSDAPIDVVWQQYGPVDLPAGGYIDRRRFHIGYQPIPQRDPTLVKSNNDDYMFERGDVIKRARRADDPSNDAEYRRQQRSLWPSAESQTSEWQPSWFGTTNRYFGMTIHPPLRNHAVATYSLQDSVEGIEAFVTRDLPELVYTRLRSPQARIEPGASRNFDLGIYAGPLDRDVLTGQPYSSLEMAGMIVYSMGGCCTFLTFQWLAHGLLWFLEFLHDYVLFDWGLAIMMLVVVVRALLHPLTKKSQVNMQRFGKQMSAMKPEIDKIQKKFAGDPKKAQQEQMRLMREHGVNPLQMLGCLPMFLQMPIWLALWAMLYLAFDIRHEPAFYGVFQLFGGWQFLADLSSADNFWILPGGGFTIPLVNVEIPSLNLLPLLMGLVFFFQQKYMSPPPTPNMTPEQLQQQKIMKVMMVVMFPLFLYKAPSGLTLYIFTSSCIGILESKYIRQHITEMDLNPPKPAVTGEPRKKPKDPWARAWAQKLERAKAKRDAAAQQRFKKRK